MKILLTGKDGQLGWELQRSLAPLGEVIAFDRSGLDLADPDQIVARVRDAKPEVIVNAAAYTSVDLAESEPELAMAINGTAPGVLAEEARRLDCLLVHYSTDYVFDGKKKTPYTEEDLPNPLNVYGKTKLAGEVAIQNSGCRHLTLRTAWVYSDRGRNFLLTILRLANEKPELRVVCDQHGAPTWAREIAEASSNVLMHPALQDGIYHLTATGQTTWFEFARTIVENRNLRTQVVPIKSGEFPTAALRPTNSLLSTAKLHDAYGVSLRHWAIALKECLETLTRSADLVR